MKSTIIKGIALSALCLVTLESYGSYAARFARHNANNQQTTLKLANTAHFSSPTLSRPIISPQISCPIVRQLSVGYATQSNTPRKSYYPLYQLKGALIKALPPTPDAYVRGFAIEERQLLLAKYLVNEKKAYRNPDHCDYRPNIIEYESGLAYESDPNTKKFRMLFQTWFNIKRPVVTKIPIINKVVHTANYAFNDYKLDDYSRVALQYLLLIQATNNNNKILKEMLKKKALITDKTEQELLKQYTEQFTNLAKNELHYFWRSCARSFTDPNGNGATALTRVPATVIRGVIQHVRDTYKNQELESLAQELDAVVEKTQRPQSVPSQHQEDVVSSTTLD